MGVGLGGRAGGIGVVVKEKLKFFEKKIGGGGWGSGGGGRVVGGGFRMDVNAILGVGGDVGYGGCEPRKEGIVQCTKRYCTILRKIKMWGGGAIFEPKTLSMYLKKE